MNTQNTLKTALLLGALTGLFMLIGSLLGGTGGMIMAFVFAIMMNMGAWWFSDSIALRMSGAQEVSPQQAPDLHRMVEQLSANADMPKPRVYVIDSPMPNAFATGRSPEKGAVAVTTGITKILNRDELGGVIAHELAHIKHRDTLISSVAATIAGAITMIASIAQWSLIFGGFGSNDDDEGAGSLIGGLVMIFVAPLAATLIQMAISRSREFSADAGGAAIAGDPMSLANALQKLESWSQQQRGATDMNPASAHMYIVNPLSGNALAGLFSTHPPTEVRIQKLQELARNKSARQFVG